MAKLPEAFIADVLERVNIETVINGRVPLKKAGAEFTACCPFHDEKSPSFSVIPKKQAYYCFGCGAGGNAINFLMNYEVLDFRGAVEALAVSVGLSMPVDAKAIAAANDGPTAKLGHACRVAVAKLFCDRLKHCDEAKAYLKARGISGETALAYRIGYAPQGNEVVKTFSETYSSSDLCAVGVAGDKGRGAFDFFRDRLMFPCA